MVLEEHLFYSTDHEDNDFVIRTRTSKPVIPRNLRKEFYNLVELKLKADHNLFEGVVC